MDPTFDKSNYMKIDEAARFLGVSRRTVYRRVWNGELPAAKVGGLYFIRRADLQKLLAQGSAAMHEETRPPVSEQTVLKCGACYRILQSDSQIGEVCHAEGCDELICQQCLAEGVQYCAQHSPTREQKWEQAQARRQRGEIPLLLKASSARLREINLLNRLQTRLEHINTLAHPASSEVLTIENWGSHLEQRDQRAEVMRLLGKVVLDTGALASTPLNAALLYTLPPQKNQKGLPLRIRVQVLSRIPVMLRDGFDTAPLGMDDLVPWLERLSSEAERSQTFKLALLASTTGWDAPARQQVLGGAIGTAFSHKNVYLYLFDLESGELIYNPRDERLRGYAELFTPLLPAEEISQAAKAVEKETLIYDSLALSYAAEILPYPRSVLQKAFESLAASGRYALMDLPDLGVTIVKQSGASPTQA